MAPRPTWQQDDCPSWCAVAHHEDDHPDDRKHVSVTRTVPVVELAVDGPTGRDVPRATELVVLAQRRDGAVDTWLYVGDGREQLLQVTPGSWRRLVGSILEHLGEVDAE